MAQALGSAKTTACGYLEQLERSSLLAFRLRTRSGSAAVRKPATIYPATASTPPAGAAVMPASRGWR